jgi:hypothetical protein
VRASWKSSVSAWRCNPANAPRVRSRPPARARCGDQLCAPAHAQRRTVLKYRYGQLWNNKLALRSNSATPTNAHCAKLTEAATSPRGCQDPIMKRMYTERHKAGRILLDAIYNGARGSDICMADVGTSSAANDGRPRPQPRARRDAPPQADQGTEEHAGGCAPSGQTSCFATRKDTRRKTERGTTSASWSSRPKTRDRPTS